MVFIEDFLCGFLFAQVTFFVVGWWSIFIGIISGICWIGGGQGWLGTKGWRRGLVPLLIVLPFVFNNHLLNSLISFLFQIGWQSVGYGEPSYEDKGSWLGRRLGEWTRPIWLGVYVLTLVPLLI